MLHLSLPLYVGSRKNSILVELISDLDSKPLLGQVANTISVSYLLRQDNLRTPALNALVSPKSAYTPNGWCELSPVRLPGLYRLDIPNNLLERDGRSDFLLIGILAIGAVPYYVQIPILEQDGTLEQQSVREKL